MQIKVTKTKVIERGVEFEYYTGDIEYHDSYIVITYRDPQMHWIEIAIPWRIINEVEVKP